MHVVQMPESRTDSSNTQVTPDPELEKHTRCRFPAEYKLRIGVESMQNTASNSLPVTAPLETLDQKLIARLKKTMSV
jgi:hypothetical protein